MNRIKIKAMRTLFTLLFFGITLACFSQDISEISPQRTIEIFFDGFHKGDTTVMRTVMMPDMKMQSAITTGKGEYKVNTMIANDFLVAIAKRPENVMWEEIIHEYVVQEDGNLASVWTPYSFSLNGELSHCGANSFTLVRTVEGWKINYIIDSRRRNSCEK